MSVLEELVGEGKKFSTAEDLAKGKKESDAFIETLKSENGELRTLVTTLGTKHDELASKVDFLSKLNGKPNGNPNGSEPKTPDTKQDKGLTADDVSNMLIQREAAQRAQVNEAAVNEVLVKQFGAEAKKFMTDKAGELGMSFDELQKIAQRSPSAFYNMVGVNPSGSKGNLNITSNSHSSKGTPSEGDNAVRGRAYWEKKRQEVGSWKFATNRELNVQMHKDMRDLGDRWDSN